MIIDNKMNFIATTGTDLNSLSMISYTLSILFFDLNPLVKKLLSIEIVIFHITYSQ
jgi:hypothetical protein